MLNIKSFPVILLHWLCLISWCMYVLRWHQKYVCVVIIYYRVRGVELDKSGCFSFPPSSFFLLFLSQLKHMMVMTGYPDFLLKPELIDEEYGVSHEPPVSRCTMQLWWFHTNTLPSYLPITFPSILLSLSSLRGILQQALQCMLSNLITIEKKYTFICKMLIRQCKKKWIIYIDFKDPTKCTSKILQLTFYNICI